MLVPIIAKAPADLRTREAWLERLFDAHQAEKIPYIESLTEYWGELCGSKELASQWADRLSSTTRMALSPDPTLHAHFHGTSACLSALYEAERYEEIVDILRVDAIWHYKRWAVKALAAMGKKSEAIRYAESNRGRWAPDEDVNSLCEEILLSSGLVEEAYRRYGLRTERNLTYLATFRSISKKYPNKDAAELLADLVKTTPGQEAKWFAAAKDAGLYDEALALAGRGPCDPKTLTRAARDFADERPDFALAVGLLALRWLVEGYGYEVMSTDVWAAYSSVMNSAERANKVTETQKLVRQLVAQERTGGFVTTILAKDLGL